MRDAVASHLLDCIELIQQAHDLIERAKIAQVRLECGLLTPQQQDELLIEGARLLEDMKDVLK